MFSHLFLIGVFLMIDFESDAAPSSFSFDIALVAVGYERRCRWITESFDIQAHVKLGLEFGFLEEASYESNKAFFESRSYMMLNGIRSSTPADISAHIISAAKNNSTSDGISLFVDISSMSREMIANVVHGINMARNEHRIHVTSAYAPSKFSKSYGPSPIRSACPITPSLAGWSSRPEQPLGTVFGLGCEPGLALGAMQVLEPDKVWLFSPRGVDSKFDDAMRKPNQHIDDIFDVTEFEYEITRSTVTRGRFEALLNAIEGDFRVIAVPFGPKIFSWLSIITVVFTERSSVGVWAFSSKDAAFPVDRDADGNVIWHSFTLNPK